MLTLVTPPQYFPDGGKRIHQLTDESEVQEPLDPLTQWLLAEAGPPVRELSIHELWEVSGDFYFSCRVRTDFVSFYTAQRAARSLSQGLPSALVFAGH